MRFLQKIIIPCLIAVSVSCSNLSTIETKGKLDILHLKGSPYEQGIAHGTYLKDEIQTIIKRWKTEVEEGYDTSFKVVRDAFFTQTNYLSFVKTYCPEVLDEIMGIAEGSDIDYETILAFQMGEEIDVLSGSLLPKNCTAIGVNPNENHRCFLAQNMDPPSHLHGYPTLLHKTYENGLQQYIFTTPGLIGLNGLNSNGVGITCNSISMLNSATEGLPVAFVIQSVLKQESEKDAFEFIKAVKHAIPQCYTIGGTKEVKCFECSSNEVKEYITFKDEGVVLHTNFSIANRDFDQQFIDILAQYGKTVDDPYFCPRFFLGYDEIVEKEYNLNVPSIQEILSLNEPELEPISSEQTYGCLIMELTNKPILHLAPDRPDTTKFLTFTFDD